LFCVIYELKVKPEMEQKFRDAWRKVTLDVMNECGSLGARLHKSDDGSWIAYAQWPDRESWQHGHKVIEEQTIALHADDYLLEIPTALRSLTVVEDLLKFKS
jgi:quinol monooxygenase YgiN